ncbi:hypothetical protein TRVL_08360 [Trypanosoma vivax]|nr:hypothetical protein TRVL_08360 [Trypanosoma vivax]
MLAIHCGLGSASSSELAAMGVWCSKKLRILSGASTDMEHKRPKHNHVPHALVPSITTSPNSNKAPTSTKISERSCGEHGAHGAKQGDRNVWHHLNKSGNNREDRSGAISKDTTA